MIQHVLFVIEEGKKGAVCTYKIPTNNEQKNENIIENINELFISVSCTHKYAHTPHHITPHHTNLSY